MNSIHKLFKAYAYEKKKRKSGIVYDLQCYIMYTNLFTNIYSFYVFLCLLFPLHLFCVVRIKSCILIYSKADKITFVFV